MQLTLPRTEKYPDAQVRVTVRSGEWVTVTTVDSTYRTLDVTLPADVSEDDTEAFTHFVNASGEVYADTGATVLKTKVRKRRFRQTPPPESAQP